MARLLLFTAILLFLPLWLPGARSHSTGVGAETPATPPQHENTISGEVRIKDKEGNPREDRSDVVVFIDVVKAVGSSPTHREKPVMSQKNQQFQPRVMPIVRGTTVDFPNDDLVFHNVFSLSRAKPFDLSIYPKGESRSVTFEQPGLVKVYCNIHPQMVANILVLNNPYFAVTSKEGLFAIHGVPDGGYLLRTWHELGGGYDKEIEVTGGAVLSYTVDITETKTSVRHKNKFGRDYSGKYE